MTDYRVEVYCAEPFHDGARVHLDVLTRRAGEWTSQSGKLIYLGPGDVPLGPAGPELWANAVAASARSAPRRVYSLRCRCGVNPVWRWEKLIAVLHVLSDNQVKHVSVNALGRRVEHAC
jgi:hypothetical protein